jgi:hypothetical protein
LSDGRAFKNLSNRTGSDIITSSHHIENIKAFDLMGRGWRLSQNITGSMKMPKHLYLIIGYSSKRCCSVDRRNMLKFLGGVGLGAIAAETYEMVHHIPLLERRFVEEVNYWINQYHIRGQANDLI